MFLGSSEWGMFHLLKGASTEMEARLERERSGFFDLSMPSLLSTDSRGCHSGVTWPSGAGDSSQAGFTGTAPWSSMEDTFPFDLQRCDRSIPSQCHLGDSFHVQSPVPYHPQGSAINSLHPPKSKCAWIRSTGCETFQSG